MVAATARALRRRERGGLRPPRRRRRYRPGACAFGVSEAAARREAATSEGETLEVDHGFGGGGAGQTFSQYFATFRRKDVKRFPKGANDSREWRAQKT
jgi:hypothetical protein